MRRHKGTVLDVDQPFLWAKADGDGARSYTLVNAPAGPERVSGIQVPLFGHRGLQGAISFGGHQIRADPEARVAITLVGTAGFRAARRILDPGLAEQDRLLTVREREVLRWTAAGRRQSEIAAIMQLSERTVENHLRNARRRLAATTTAHMVTLTIGCGEIDA